MIGDLPTSSSRSLLKSNAISWSSPTAAESERNQD